MEPEPQPSLVFQWKEQGGSKASGSGWKGTQLSSATSGDAPEIALDISEISRLTHPSQRTQLTARVHLVLGKDESSKCHSSSAVTPCLS